MCCPCRPRMLLASWTLSYSLEPRARSPPLCHQLLTPLGAIRIYFSAHSKLGLSWTKLSTPYSRRGTCMGNAHTQSETLSYDDQLPECVVKKWVDCFTLQQVCNNWNTYHTVYGKIQAGLCELDLDLNFHPLLQLSLWTLWIFQPLLQLSLPRTRLTEACCRAMWTNLGEKVHKKLWMCWAVFTKWY